MTRNAIILAGGRGTRLGGTVKAAITRNGISLLHLLSRALDECDCGPRVCVGPSTLDLPVNMLRTCEEPPEGGPAAGIVWGMQALGLLDKPEGQVAVFSVDAPGAATAAPRLFSALDKHSEAEAAMLAGQDGTLHHLLAVYRAEALVHNIHQLSTQLPGITDPWFAKIRGIAAKRLVGNLRVVTVEERCTVAPESRDIDTPADLSAWHCHAPSACTHPLT